MRSPCSRSRLLLIAAAALAACGGGTDPTPQPCTYAVSVSSNSFGASGGSGTASITTGSGCSWTAASGASWISISGATSGSGPGSVSFSVAASADTSSRTGSLTIAGQSASIRQDGAPVACVFSIAPATAAFDKDGGSGAVAVQTPAGCAWTASTPDTSWLTIAANQGVGSGSMAYTVSKNTQPGGRTGTIAVAGNTHTVTQSGDVGACTYSVSNVEFSPCMLATEMTTTLSTQATCPWTVETSAPWLSVSSGNAGSGPATIHLRVTENYEAPRAAVAMIRWPTPTAGQNVRVNQAGCYYTLTPDALTFAAAGGNGTFEVFQMSEPYTCGGPLQNGCLWTASSDVPWVTVTTSMPRSGDDRVSFTVAANTTGASRVGSIVVRGKTVRITQGG